MTTLESLARDCAPQLAVLRSAASRRVVPYDRRRKPPSWSKRRNRARWLKWRAKQTMTHRKAKSAGVKRLFPFIAERLGISIGAVQMRFYRSLADSSIVELPDTDAPDYHAKWQQRKRQALYAVGMTCLGEKRKTNRLPKPAPIFFTELGEKLGISKSAAMMRYYRKQIQADVLREVGK